jgi:outer membrane protein OmpA-like peptidoglycan-associated protein
MANPNILRLLAAAAIALLAAGCGGAQKSSEGSTLEPEEGDDKEQAITVIEYEQKTRELLQTSEKLASTRTELDDQKRRLQAICIDYPDHHVCQPQTQAMYARKAFCEDREFTTHVDDVVAACHEGECKQLADAAEISRQDYMLLTQRLPHSLITFRAGSTKLDTSDKKQMQQFLEQLMGEEGYVIIVGRASRDGPWKLNVKLALERAYNTRAYLIEQLGVDPTRVGYITYGHEKMYLTNLDAERLSNKKLTVRQANRSALVFSYPCYEGKPTGAY